MLEKARARDRQREVAGDRGQWGFVLQGMRPHAEARSRGGQRKVVGDKERWALFVRSETSCTLGCRTVFIIPSELCFARSETSCNLGCRRGSSHQEAYENLMSLIFNNIEASRFLGEFSINTEAGSASKCHKITNSYSDFDYEKESFHLVELLSCQSILSSLFANKGSKSYFN
jgi:hypothetical protein